MVQVGRQLMGLLALQYLHGSYWLWEPSKFYMVQLYPVRDDYLLAIEFVQTLPYDFS